MSEPRSVKLGGREFPVVPQPFRVMKALQPAMNRALRDMHAMEEACDVTEEQLGHLIATVAMGLGVPADELEALTFRTDSAFAALMAIFEVNEMAGLSPNGLAAVKAMRKSSDGTTSTPASPPAPDGDGRTSTT